MLFLLDSFCPDADKIIANIIADANLDPEQFRICPDPDEDGIDILGALTDVAVSLDADKEIPVIN